MKILYYVEPWTELKDDFRFPTLRAVVAPEIRALMAADPRHEIVVIHGDGVADAIRVHDFRLPEARLVQISQADLCEIFPDYEAAQATWYHQAFTRDQLEYQQALIKRSVGSFVPDLIVAYETNVPFLREMYPGAAIVHAMFGALSRIPFPSFSSFDPCGVFKNSFIRLHARKIRDRVLADEERHALTEIRRLAGSVLLRNDPVYQDIARLRRRFDHVVLLALQVDHYFAFTECTPYASQKQLLQEVLSTVPPSVAVIVTEHGEYPSPFSEADLRALRSRYPNFVYNSGYRTIPFISQFLIPHIDAVITVSSSVAYQALFWKKPVYAVGDSQINGFAAAEGVSSIPEALTAPAPDMDGFLYYILSTAHVFSKFNHFNGAWLSCEYDRAVQAHRNGPIDFDYFKPHSTPDALIERFRGALRAVDLEKALKDKGVKPAPNVLFAKALAARSVSFDLFDTLVQRPFVEPHDIFQLIQSRVQQLLGNRNFPFHRLRREAEADVRRRTGGNVEVTLEEIYQRLGENIGIQAEKLDAIMRLEIRAELAMVKPRPEVLRIFNQLRDLGWSVSIITDIYLNRPQIEAILKRCGICGWSDLLISAEAGKRKQNGTLYLVYLDRLFRRTGVVASDNLHVGDNPLADGEMAAKFGIKTHIIPKSIDRLRKSKLGIVLKAPLTTPHITVSALYGLQANRIFCDPHASYDTDTLFDGDLFNLGYLAIGPIVTSFTHWLIDRCKRHGIEELFFLARDGWVLKVVYDILTRGMADAPRAVYTYCSRRATIVASLRTVDDLIEAASQDFDARSLREFLEYRLGVTIDRISDDLLARHGYSETDIVSPLREIGRFHDFLREAAPVILENAATEREGYLAYLASLGLNGSCGKRQAVVDIGYAGSMQQQLIRLLERPDLGGFYLLTHAHARHNFDCAIFEGFLASLDDHRTPLRHPLNDHVFLFESVLSSMEGSLTRVRLNGDGYSFDFLEADQENMRRSFIQPVHEGVEAFAKDVATAFCGYEDAWYISPTIATRLFINSALYPHWRDAQMFERLEVENKFGGGDARLIADKSPFFHSKDGLSRASVAQLVNASKWKQGAMAALSAYVRVPEPPKKAKNITTVDKATTALASDVKKAKNITMVDKATTSLATDVRTRKLHKLARDPYRYFQDARIKILRPLKYAFGNHRLGCAASNFIRNWAEARIGQN